MILFIKLYKFKSHNFITSLYNSSIIFSLIQHWRRDSQNCIKMKKLKKKNVLQDQIKPIVKTFYMTKANLNQPLSPNGILFATSKFTRQRQFGLSSIFVVILLVISLTVFRKYLTEIDTSIFMAGKLIGAFLLGIASDIFGRRKIFFLSVLLLVLSGLVAYIAPFYSLYLIARLLAGIANSGISSKLIGFTYQVKI